MATDLLYGRLTYPKARPTRIKARRASRAMKAVLDDIVAQLKLCAALMSDAELLREQAHVVAAQFRVAASRIEQLKAYLKKPSKGVSPDKPWFDEAILDGVGGLVDVTLRRHMLPLGKGFEFPKVFEKELKRNSLAKVDTPAHGEHLLKREIKETNCMGAVILLYYFLYWHVVLILFNYHNHPMCYADHMQEEEEGLTQFVQKALRKLPRGKMLLEHRILTGILSSTASTGPDELKTRTDFNLNGLYSNDEVRSDTKLNTRVSFAVDIWRGVLKDEFCFDESTENSKVKSSEIHALLGFCIGNRLDMFGGVLSTFELQDDIDKWNDMDRILQVQSTTEDPSAGTYAQYAYRLANVLKSLPYSTSQDAFRDKAYIAAVHDYGSVVLMTDIAKSFISLARVVKQLLTEYNPGKVTSKIGQMIAVLCNQYDDATIKKLKNTDTRKDKTKYHMQKFVQFTPNWRRNACNVSDTFFRGMYVFGKCVVDDLGGYYWGAQPCDLIQHNHAYLACPSVEKDLQGNTTITGAFQALYPNDANFSAYFFAYLHLIFLHKNSLFISLTCQSLLKFTETLNLLWRNNPVSFNTSEVLRPLPKKAASNGLRLYGNKIAYNIVAEQIETLPEGDADEDTNTSITSLRKLLQLELTVLHNRVEQAKTAQFQKYPGISWPIRFKAKPTLEAVAIEADNFAQFNPIHDIPRTIPSLAESADGVARAVHKMSTSAVFNRDFVAGSRSGAGAGGAGAEQPRPAAEAGATAETALPTGTGA
jgi:hypothetical protein